MRSNQDKAGERPLKFTFEIDAAFQTMKTDKKLPEGAPPKHIQRYIQSARRSLLLEDLEAQKAQARQIRIGGLDNA